MSLETALNTYLNTLGDAYDHSLPKEGASYPALRFQMIFEGREGPLDRSDNNQDETLYQIDILASTKTAAKTIARQIMTDYHGFYGSFNGVDIVNCLVQIIGEDEDKDVNLKLVTLEMRFYQ